MTEFVTAGAGFLLAVLWFDLMFDVQVLRHRGSSGPLPSPVLDSLSGYYGQVTTGSRPMNRLVALAMVATLMCIGIQAARHSPHWVGIVSFGLALGPITLAATHTVPAAVRLGGGAGDPEDRSALARAICRDHLVAFAGILALLVVQLAFGP